MEQNKCVIAVPLYKESFDIDEFNSITQLFKILGKYDIIAFCPNSLDVSYYINNFNFKNYYNFWDDYFYNYPRGYNRLMLASGFYKTFSEYEYMLIYQPDCWVFKDELEYWCNKGYDFIGAPFLFTRNDEFKLKACPIGNGGFSLRKISFWINLCNDQSELCQYICNMNDTEYGEDHILVSLSTRGVKYNYNVPSWEEAARFAYETDPHISYIVTNYTVPFGCHAYNKILGKQFYDDFNLYKDKKCYSIVTFLFGDYDILRDPDEVDPSAEYICITDRKDLQSNVWEFVELQGIDVSQFNDWQKTLIARYTALDYIHTDICIKIDASVHIKKSPSFITSMLTKNNTINALFMLHPWRDNYLTEYDEWINTRGLDPQQKETFINYCKDHNYNIDLKGMIMTTIMVQKNNEINKVIDKYVLNELLHINNFNVRVDQTYFSIIFSHVFFSNVEIKFISMQVLDSDYFEYYYHGKNYTHSGEYKYDPSKVDFKYYINNKYPCMYFI